VAEQLLNGSNIGLLQEFCGEGVTEAVGMHGPADRPKGGVTESVFDRPGREGLVKRGSGDDFFFRIYCLGVDGIRSVDLEGFFDAFRNWDIAGMFRLGDFWSDGED